MKNIFFQKKTDIRLTKSFLKILQRITKFCQNHPIGRFTFKEARPSDWFSFLTDMCAENQFNSKTIQVLLDYHKRGTCEHFRDLKKMLIFVNKLSAQYQEFLTSLVIHGNC